MFSCSRPYGLHVVHPSEAGSEHYIFSPKSVLHVTERGYGGLVSLAEWYKESALWTALQKIPFLRDFRLRKAFTWLVSTSTTTSIYKMGFYCKSSFVLFLSLCVTCFIFIL